MPKGVHLAEFEIYVMLAVTRLGDGVAYGMTIRSEIEARTGRPVAIGAVYATLGRLHDKGYVVFTYSEPEPVPGGRARKLVALSRFGRRALATSMASLERMAEGLTLVPVQAGKR